MKISAYNVVQDESIELDPNVWIRIGEGRDRISIWVRDGVVEISGEGRIAIEPRAANLVYVKPVR